MYRYSRYFEFSTKKYQTTSYDPRLSHLCGVSHGERQQARRHWAAVLPLVLQCLQPRSLHLRFRQGNNEDSMVRLFSASFGSAVEWSVPEHPSSVSVREHAVDVLEHAVDVLRKEGAIRLPTW